MSKGAAWWVLVPIMAALLLFAAIFALVHLLLKDELRPEVAASLNPEIFAPPVEENLFFALIGASSNGDQRWSLRGAALWETYQALTPDERLGTFLVSPDARVQSDGDLSALCTIANGTGTPNCIDHLAQRRLEVRTVLEKNEDFLQRYRTLESYRRYQAPPKAAGEAFLASPVLLQGLELHIADLDLRLQQIHEIDAVLSDWEKTSEFWRFLLRSADDSLIGKMVAVAASTTVLQLSGEWLSRDGLSQTQRTRLRSIFKPYHPEALSMRAAMTSEARLVAQAIDLIDSGDATRALELDLPESGFGQWIGERMLGFLFMPNDSRNQLYDSTMAVVEQHQDNSCPNKDADRLSAHAQAPGVLRRLRNPVGRILVDVGTPDYASFFDRICDLEGYRRLQFVRHLAIEKGIGAVGIPAFIEQLPESLSDPYGGKMHWESARAGFSFGARSKRARALLPLSP